VPPCIAHKLTLKAGSFSRFLGSRNSLSARRRPGRPAQVVKRLQSLAHSYSFPAPFHSGNVALWRLAHVSQWLAERGTYRVERSLLEVSRVAMQINLVKESANIGSDARR
jgi:hypothetical protein